MAEALDAAIPDKIDELARRVLQRACDRRVRLVTAESCTGGLLASLLTDIPGCSHAFERGFVTYSDDAKREMLGVSQKVLDSPGPVSVEAARAMAEGALTHSRGDIALAITGYADDAPQGQGQSGLVYLAVARRGGAVRCVKQAFGPIGRAQVRIRSLEAALKLISTAL